MSYNFGTNPAPAPSAFSFGNPSSAPATSSGFSFGNQSPAPAASSGFSFGNPAPATSSGFSFGNSSPAPAATSSFSFGNQAPAATTGFSFGNPAPAPSATMAGFGTSAGQPGTSAISGATPYYSLPADIRQAIDTIHEAMMKHKRAMINLQSMAPMLLLREEDHPKLGILSAGSSKNSVPLSVTVRKLHEKIAMLEQERGLQAMADSCKDDYQALLKQGVMYGQWQIEALAIRRGVHLRQVAKRPQQHQAAQSDGDSGKDGQISAKEQLQAVLDGQLKHVDRLERMPSPFLWQIIEDMEARLANLKHNGWTVEQQIHNSMRSEEPEDIASVVQSQHRSLYKVSQRLAALGLQVEQLRNEYRFYERGENVLEKAHFEEQERERRLNDRIRMQYVQAAAKSTAVPAPTPGGFGASASSAPSFGGFAPAPAIGFGSAAPSPGASASGFSFSGTPASSTPAATTGATSSTSIFGSAPAPSNGGVFGAPSVSSAFNFGSSTASATAAPAPKPKGKSRGKGGRLKS